MSRRLLAESDLDLVGGLFQQLLGAAEGDADVVLALRSEDSAGGQEHVGLLHHLVRECEAVALVALGQLGPHEQARLSLAVAASQRVEQFVSLLLAAVVDVVQLLEPLLAQRQRRVGSGLMG